MRSGEMVPLATDRVDQLLKEFKDLADVSEAAKRDAFREQIPPHHLGAVLFVGEMLEIKGGKFRVDAVTEGRVYLRPLPGGPAHAR